MSSKNFFNESAVITIALATAPAIAFAQAKSDTFLEENKVAVALMICLYLLPGWIAWSRKHPSKWAIIFVDVFLGWSGIGWIVALIWSLGATKTQTVMVTSDGVPVPTNAQTAPLAAPVATKTVAERIGDLKAMLDSGAISQAEYDLLKADAMKGIG